jgi:uncharacterized membrane protein YgaE (UPF0421/DUF939 family)
MHFHYRYKNVEDRRYVVGSTVALAALTAVLGTAAVGGGVAAGVNALSNPDKSQANAANDIAVTQQREVEEQKAAILEQTKQAAEAPGKAQAAAKSEIEKRKRIVALSGGKTLLSSEGYLGGGTPAKTLLGS